MAVEVNCAICLQSLLESFDEFENQLVACALICGHVFHDSCMQTLQEVRNKQSLPTTCPSCNVNVEQHINHNTFTVERKRLYINYDPDTDNWTDLTKWPRTAVLGSMAADVMRLASEMVDAKINVEKQTVELVEELHEIGNRLARKHVGVSQTLMSLGKLKERVISSNEELVLLKAKNTLQEKMPLLIPAINKSAESIEAACERIRLPHTKRLDSLKADLQITEDDLSIAKAGIIVVTAELNLLKSEVEAKRRKHHAKSIESEEALLKMAGERDDAVSRVTELLKEQADAKAWLAIARNITKEVVLDAESAETDKSNLYLLLGERDQEIQRLLRMNRWLKKEGTSFTSGIPLSSNHTSLPLHRPSPSDAGMLACLKKPSGPLTRSRRFLDANTQPFTSKAPLIPPVDLGDKGPFSGFSAVSVPTIPYGSLTARRSFGVAFGNGDLVVLPFRTVKKLKVDEAANDDPFGRARIATE